MSGPNTYMQLTDAGGIYRRSGSTSCTGAKPVLSETYVHMWGDGYDLNRAHGGTIASTGTPRNPTTENATKAFDDLMTPVNGTDWCVRAPPRRRRPSRFRTRSDRDPSTA